MEAYGGRATVRLWRVGDGALQQVLTGHSDSVRGVAFSPDGKCLACSGEDRRVHGLALEHDFDATWKSAVTRRASGRRRE